LPALHPARAARRGAGPRAVELPLAHLGERRRAGAPRRQHGGPEDGAADAPRRRALPPGFRSRRPAGWRVPVPPHRSRVGGARQTTLGPLVRTEAANSVRAQIRDALNKGARALLDPKADREGTPYLAPQILVDVDHGMAVMTEETFGPVVGIMAVATDEEAIGC